MTIDGVCFVVDSGLEKKIVYDARQNVSSLREVSISRSSAQQRRGRAGRTRPGTCYRLYSRDDFLLMSETQTAEVLSQPVNLTLLSLYAMKLEPSTFPWLEAPDPAAMAVAAQNLVYLGALEDAPAGRYQLTEFGQLAAHLQMEPARARVLHEGRRMGLLGASGDLVGIMSASQNFLARTKEATERAEMKGKLEGRVDVEGDLVTMYRLYVGWKAAIATAPGPGAEDACDATQLPVELKTPDQDSSDSDDDEALERAARRLQRPVRTKRNWKLGEAYCEAHHLNKRTMALIGKLSFECLRQVDNFYKKPQSGGERAPGDDSSRGRGLSVGSMDEEEQAPADPDKLRRLILAGSFLNIAVRISDRSGDGLMKGASYQHLTPGNENIVAGVIHPGSLVVQYDREARGPFICFLSLLSTSMMFMHTITCLDLPRDELIRQVAVISPAFSRDMRAALDGICSEKIEVGGFSRSSVTGKRAATFRQRLSLDYKTSVHANFFTGVYTAYCRLHQVQDLTLALEEHRRVLRDEAVLAVEEDLLAGSTRCVYCRGGEVLAILFGQECISVTIMNLPDSIDDALLRALLEGSYGPVRLLEVWDAEGRQAQQVVERGSLAAATEDKAASCQTHNKVAKATFEDKASAARCLASLQRDFAESLLVVRPGGIAVSPDDDVAGRLEMTWDCRDGPVVDAEALLVSVAQLKFCVPLINEDPVLESFFFTATDSRGVRYPRAGFKIYYKALEDVERAANQWKTSAAMRAVEAPPQVNALAMRQVYECKIIVNKELYEWMATQGGNPLAALLQRNAGGKVFTKGIKNVSIFLCGNQQHKVAQLRLEVQELLSFSVFAHPKKDALFSFLGRQTMARMSAKELRVVYIHWDHRSRTVRVYGTADQRQEGLGILAAVVDKLCLLTSATFLLHKSKADEVKSGQAKAFFAQAKREHGLEELEMRGLRVIPWGEPANVEAFGVQLRGQGWLARDRKAAAAAETDCGTCFCELDTENMQLQACLHCHCTACVSRTPLEAETFPIKCSTCAEHLTLQDLQAALDGAQVGRIHSLAQGHFKMGRGSAEVTYCPSDGCNMLIKLPPQTESEGQERAQGGLVSHCDECRLDLCLPCSALKGKIVPPHKSETCVEARAGGSADIVPYRKHIENLLCP